MNAFVVYAIWPHPACCLVLYLEAYWHTASSSVHPLVAALRSWIEPATKAMCPQSPKDLLSEGSKEKLADSRFKSLVRWGFDYLQPNASYLIL